MTGPETFKHFCLGFSPLFQYSIIPEVSLELSGDQGCDRLSLNEKGIPHPRNTGHPPSRSLRDLSLQKSGAFLQLVLFFRLVVLHPHYGWHHLSPEG